MTNFNGLIMRIAEEAHNVEQTAIALGNVLDRADVHQYGSNTNVTTTQGIIAPQGGTLLYPTGANVITVSSSSLNDVTAGTGAITAEIHGLDSSYSEISEIVTLNGQTAVNTVNSYLRVNKFHILTAGSLGKNDGIIYVGEGVITTGVPATIYMQVAIGKNHSQSAAYTVPAGKTAIFNCIYVGVSSGKTVTMELNARELGGLFQAIFTTVASTAFIDKRFFTPKIFPEKTDIQVCAAVDTTGAEVHGGLEITLKTP